MRLRLLLLGALAALGAGASLLLVARADGPEWTSDSPEALAELEAGIEDYGRFYFQDAQAHFEKAAALDPDLIVARLFTVGHTKDPEKRKAVLERIRKVDLSRYNDRERYLATRLLLLADGKYDEARQQMLDYMEAHPDDVWAMSDCASEAFRVQDMEKAERLFRRILELDPNRVEAQNLLGYVAMAQGRFPEAEERFRTYRFIAPDQANPHDSLGELFIIVGRAEEAAAELEEALRMKPDFCPSVRHLLDLATSTGSLHRAAADALLARAGKSGCSPRDVEDLRCRIETWLAFHEGRCDAIDVPECEAGFGEVAALRHRCYLRLGQVDRAEALQAAIAEKLTGKDKTKAMEGEGKALMAHMEGLRAAAEGDVDRASMLLQDADQEALFWGDGQGIFKLVNQLTLARVLSDAGRTEASEQVLKRVRQVNPTLADRFLAEPDLFRVTPDR